jgi:hypothetical protein
VVNDVCGAVATRAWEGATLGHEDTWNGQDNVIQHVLPEFVEYKGSVLVFPNVFSERSVTLSVSLVTPRLPVSR